jgi:DNA-binding GntR family transcriptional regulator
MKLSEQLREAIEERILVGTYPAGSRLDEVEIATSFGVSRTPIREALIQLASAGLIESRPRRGSVVAQVSPARLQQMFEVMAELEALCTRFAAERADDASRAAVVAAHVACEAAVKAKDPDAYYRLNEQFHLSLYAACGNEFLADQTRLLHRRLRPYRRLQLRVKGRMAASFREHAAVVDAVMRGDGEAAAAAVRAHISVQSERFAQLVAAVHRPANASETPLSETRPAPARSR